MILEDLENGGERHDEIIHEVRAIRESFVEECNFDLDEIFRRSRERAAEEGVQGKSREPRRIQLEEMA